MLKKAGIVALIGLDVATALAAVDGRVIMPNNPVRAQVALGYRDVRPGDRVIVYEKECAGTRLPVCQTHRVGEAVVSRNIDAVTSEVIVQDDLILKTDHVIRKE